MAKVVIVSGYQASVVVGSMLSQTNYPIYTTDPGSTGYTSVPMFTGQMNVPSIQLINAPGIDPVDAEMAWRTGVGAASDEKWNRSQLTLEFAAMTLKEKIWRYSDINRWVEANCDDDVIVRHHHNGWEFIFVSAKDCSTFNIWMAGQHLPAYIPVTIHADKHLEDMRAWVRDHSKDLFHTVVDSRDSLFKVRFRSETDRVNFILRWIGDKSEEAV